MERDHSLRARVHALQFLQGAPHLTRLGHQGIVVLAQGVQRGLAQLQQSGGVAGPLESRLHLLVLAGLKPGARNLLHLEAQEVELLRVGFLIDDEGRFFRSERGARPDPFAEVRPLFFQAAKRIEDGELFRRMQQGLVIVRPVHVHKPFADRGQRGQRGGRAVDELTVRPSAGEGALEDQLMIVAGLQAVLLQKGSERRAQFFYFEDRLDGTAVASAAEEGAVGAVAEDEVERADDDGFAGTGFAGDDVAARLEFQREVRDQREVFDAERRQHG